MSTTTHKASHLITHLTRSSQSNTPLHTSSVLGKRRRVSFNNTCNRTYHIPRWSKALTRVTPINAVDKLWLLMYNYINTPSANWPPGRKRAKLNEISMRQRDMRAALAMLQLHKGHN